MDKETKAATGEPDWLMTLRDAGKKSDDPTVDGLVKIGGYVTESIDSMSKRLDNVDANFDGMSSKIARSEDKIQTQMEAGFGMVTEKIEQIKKRNMITDPGGGGGIFQSGDRLLAACPEEHKGLIYEAEAQMRNVKNDGSRINNDPVFRAMSAIWMWNSLKQQSPKYFGGEAPQAREATDKIRRAFDDITPGSVTKLDVFGGYASNLTSFGASTVPTLIAAEILRIMKDSGVVVRQARHFPMGAPTVEIPNEGSAIAVSWAGSENATLKTTSNQILNNTLTAKRMEAHCTASLEVIRDSVLGMLTYIQMILSEAAGKSLDQVMLEGTGTPWTGLNGTSGINTINAGGQTSTAGSSTDGATVTYNDLVRAVYAADESAIEDNAVWFMHRKTFGSILNLRDTANRPVFLGHEAGISNAPYGTLLGFPVYTTSSIGTTTSKGTAVSNTSQIYFGNPKRLILGDRQSLEFDVTDTGPGWIKYQMDIRLVGRFGFTVATPAAFTRIDGCVVLGG